MCSIGRRSTPPPFLGQILLGGKLGEKRGSFWRPPPPSAPPEFLSPTGPLWEINLLGARPLKMRALFKRCPFFLSRLQMGARKKNPVEGLFPLNGGNTRTYGCLPPTKGGLKIRLGLPIIEKFFLLRTWGGPRDKYYPS